MVCGVFRITASNEVSVEMGIMILIHNVWNKWIQLPSEYSSQQFVY